MSIDWNTLREPVPPPVRQEHRLLVETTEPALFSQSVSTRDATPADIIEAVRANGELAAELELNCFPSDGGSGGALDRVLNVVNQIERDVVGCNNGLPIPTARALTWLSWLRVALNPSSEGSQPEAEPPRNR